MSFTDAITPSNTQEVKPGLFIQKRGNSYRQVHPAAWNGKINWRNLLWGSGFFKGLLWFAILMFIVWSYQNDVGAYKDFYDNRDLYCINRLQALTNPDAPTYQGGVLVEENTDGISDIYAQVKSE